ncbi:MAG: cytochrome c [Crocinitomicaceae bacterium]|nr:cytochrome c [Crocinitomicaceae bacterium]
MRFRIVSSLAIAAISTLMLSSCGADPDSPGLEYMPDMYRSAAIEPYVDYGEIRGKFNEDAKMTLSALVPPFGTVPYYGTDSTLVSLMLPYERLATKPFESTHGMFEANFSDRDEYALAAADRNPLMMEFVLNAQGVEENVTLKRGKYLYESKCAHCHGSKGDGKGPMVESGAYLGVPDYANLTNLGDGQMFYSIYYGKGMMGAHNSLLDKKEIWTIVHYIRKFQDPNYGSSSDQVMVDVVEPVEDVEPVEPD